MPGSRLHTRLRFADFACTGRYYVYGPPRGLLTVTTQQLVYTIGLRSSCIALLPPPRTRFFSPWLTLLRFCSCRFWIHYRMDRTPDR